MNLLCLHVVSSRDFPTRRRPILPNSLLTVCLTGHDRQYTQVDHHLKSQSYEGNHETWHSRFHYPGRATIDIQIIASSVLILFQIHYVVRHCRPFFESVSESLSLPKTNLNPWKNPPPSPKATPNAVSLGLDEGPTEPSDSKEEQVQLGPS
ncbi:hypothetical protein LZ31DRAFT_343988 [Colletotrichum somersetense]|nr:hypothetical protein LZ31DRAFT_343988 [Colletotrichum somersetense]